MNKWKVIRQDGVQAGIAKEGCNSPFVTLHYVDAETIVEEHNQEVLDMRYELDAMEPEEREAYERDR